MTTSAKSLPPLRVTFDQKICGNELPDESIVVDAQGRLANAVVTLVGVRNAKPARAEPMIANEKCRFVPRVQIARPNADLKTTSQDPVLHTTHATAANGQLLFNLALPVPGMTLNRPIGGPGVARITCNTHPWMRGFVVVTNEVAAVTGTDGTFGWNDVPAGTYELRVWHESLNAVSQRITIRGGQQTSLTIRLPTPDSRLPARH